MSKHTGIKRMAEDGDEGILIGRGYLDHGSAILNIQQSDGEIIGLQCQPCDAKEIFDTCFDREIDFIYGDNDERLVGCRPLNVTYELQERE